MGSAARSGAVALMLDLVILTTGLAAVVAVAAACGVAGARALEGNER